MQRNQFNPQVIRRFMKAAAIALAVGSTATVAKPRDTSESPEPSRKSSEPRAARKPNEHRYHLALRPARGVQGEPAPEAVRVRVIDRRGRCHIDTTVSGPCRLGPLAAGDYLVMFKTQGRFDWRRMSLGDTPAPEILVRGVG